MKTVSIVMTTRNHLEMVKQSLFVLFMNTINPGEVILFDDASTDGTEEYFSSWRPADSQLEFRYVRSNENWLCGAHGQAFKYAKEVDFYISMDDDVVYVPNNWLMDLYKFDNYPKMGIMLVLDYSYIKMFTKLYGEDAFIGGLNLTERGKNYGHGYCMIFKREDYERVDGMKCDKGVYPYDADFEFRIDTIGNHVYCFGEPLIVHLGPGKSRYYGYTGKEATIRDGVDI